MKSCVVHRRIIFQMGMFCVVCSMIGVYPMRSNAYLLKDDKRGTQLSIFGLGMVRFNYAIVNGNVVVFEDNDDGILEGFDTQEFLSLTTNGTLFRDYALEGEVRYNRDDDPDWNFRFKLSRDDNYLIFGDQPNIFAEPYYTRYSAPFRGVTLHVENTAFGVTTFGAVTRGATKKQELTPDGTSGPYHLKDVPVVPGSEIVTIEIRNRYAQHEILETLPQNRNLDYTIDYDSGEITFAQPIETETFRSDPVVIVVIYRSEAESSSFGTALLGTRGVVKPTDWANLGVTYVSEFSRDPSLKNGFDSRQEVYGIDGSIRLGDAIKLTTEYALSQDRADENGSGKLRHALQATLNGKFGEPVEIHAKYQLAERDFLTFANPDIDPNQQQLDMSAKYAYRANQFLEAGYNFLQDNVPQESQSATTTTHKPFIRWDAYVREHTELFAKYEFIQKSDDLSPKKADEETQVFLVGGVQEFSSVPMLKKLLLRGEYQRSDFTDQTEQEPGTITHQFAVRAQSEPASRVMAYAEQREQLLHNKDLNKNTERQDISEFGAELNQWERFSVQSKYQYRRIMDLLADQRKSDRHTITLSSKYQPFSVLTTNGKFEFRDETFYDEGDRSSETINIEGRVVYTPQENLTTRLSYIYQQTDDTGESAAKTMEDTTEFRINYAVNQRKTRLNAAVKLERDLLEAPPTPKTKTRTITYLLSGARQISNRWDMLAQYKQEIEALAAESDRKDFLGEIGYSAGRFLKFVGGYQYTRFDNNDDSAKDYTAHSIYVKLIGKL